VTYTKHGRQHVELPAFHSVATSVQRFQGRLAVSTPHSTGNPARATLTFDGNGNLISARRVTGAAATRRLDITASISGFADGAQHQTFTGMCSMGRLRCSPNWRPESTASIEQDGHRKRAPWQSFSIRFRCTHYRGRSAMDDGDPGTDRARQFRPRARPVRATGTTPIRRLSPRAQPRSGRRPAGRPWQHYRGSLDAFPNVDIATESSNSSWRQRSYEPTPRVITPSIRSSRTRFAPETVRTAKGGTKPAPGKSLDRPLPT